MLPDSAVRATLAQAGETRLLATPPGSMVDEARFVALVHALRCNAPPAVAARVLDYSGRLTGEYVLRHRIPRLVHAMLPRLPRRFALRALLQAVGAHAWTFAGAGRFRWQQRPTGALLELADCPTARGIDADGPACDYYRACFETLLTRLVDPDLRVRETACAAQGAAACHFAADFGNRPRRSLQRSSTISQPASAKPSAATASDRPMTKLRE